MKIKPPSRKHLQRSRQRQLAYHWWLVEEQPKKVGRLSSLNKSNKIKRAHTPRSEFIIMAEKIDEMEARR